MKILPFIFALALAATSFAQTQRVTNLIATNDVKGLTFTSGGAATPAGSGVIRLGNGELIAWEASPAGTDLTLTVNSSEKFVFSAGMVVAASAVPSATDTLNIGSLTASNRGQANISGTLSIDAVGFGPSLFGRRYNGTAGTPTAVTSGQHLLDIYGGGHDGSVFQDDGASIGFVATEAWSGSAAGAEIQFSTVTNGVAGGGQTVKMKLNNDGILQSGAGLDFVLRGGNSGGATLTLDDATTTSAFNGNVTTTGSISTGTGSGVGGTLTLTEGTAPSLTANAFSIYAPVDVAAGGLAYVTPGAAATGLMLATNSSGVMTITHSAVGTGVATALAVNTGSAGAFQVNNASGAALTALTAANISTGALADGMTATTQAASDNDTSLATTAFANTAALAGMVSTYATPDTTGGAVTLTKAVTEVWTNTTTTYTIPAVASSTGKAIIFYVVGTNLITIDPNASEIVVKAGTPLSGGTALTLAGVAGNYVCLVCDGTRWVTLGYTGTLGP